MKLAERVQHISPSQTQELIGKAKEMKKAGIEVIEFQAGEPDFNTPENIKEAGIAAINENFTRYTAAPGTIELREAICEKLKKENNLDYSPEQIVVSNGGKHSLYNVFMVLVDPGDEVIVPAPYWVSYPEMVKLAGGKPVVVQADSSTDFKITPEQFEEAITDKTKILILNSPSNPTGAVYTKDELQAIAEVAVKHNIYVISDEIYEKLVYDELEFVSTASLGEDIKKLTITINGVSKAYAMTGWRIGYAAAEKEIAKAMAKVQGQATSGPSSISQKASLEAISGNQEEVEKMRKEFDKRRKFIVEKLNSIPGVSCSMPKGAFYAFPDISQLFGKTIAGVEVNDSKTFADLLLEKCHVVAVHGSAFGSEGNLRFSYATSMENIEEGLNRMEKLIKGEIK
ncbi:MAG: aspartate aminotransferase [Clostridia bacterium]|jgi:aspartate aminotransferase|nr:aatA [Clostridiales bacterium]MDK2985024.1 aspartate aminotransferase [Clostridia bacterium]